MISEDQIKKLSILYQTTELNIRREYLQQLFLSYLYQHKTASAIYFKGGTALRIIYRSPRFSEDLDFSTKLTSISDIEQVLIDTLSELEREGLVANISEAKKTTGGYLANIDFQILGVKIILQLEISLRGSSKVGQVSTIAGDFIPVFTLVSLEQSQLIDEKIQALLSRRKPRDFYDLYFILRSNLLPMSKKGVLKQALRTLTQTDINFEQELKQFLPKNQWAIIKDFKKTLEKEITRFI